MKRWLVALCLSVQALGVDVALVRKSVVKIHSSLQGVTAEFRGSGLLFERGGKRYVLTSDHVIGHVNGGLASGKHEATSSVTGEQLQLGFLAAEWGNGLALMEVLNDKDPKNAVPFTDLLAAPTAKAGDLVSFFGYPFESDDLTEESYAKLLSYRTAVPYYAIARSLVEMEAAVGEFGMSGGAAFTASGEFLGVLAYQRILEDSPANPAAANRVYAVPGAEAAAWLNEYFQAGGKYMPYFSEPWFTQGDPRQLLVSNDGLLLMFRTFQGRYRFIIGRMEHLILLKDGPTLPYHDKRGCMKILHKYMTDNPLRPSEYGLIDRSSGKPVLREIHYPAEVVTGFDDNHVSLFLILGERHEERYQRVKPLADAFAAAVSTLDQKLKGVAEWGAVSADLASLVGKLGAMPAHPANPGTAGANEFFSIDWMTDVVFQAEANASLPGWKTADAKASAEAAATRQARKALLDGFHVSEQTP